MGKQSVKVVIRTRPTPNFATKNIQIDPINSHVTVHIPKDSSGGHINNVQENWKFKFDKIMHNASQEDLFEFCAQEVVQSVTNGFNGTVMCYGQTGAGKTFTMNGATPNFKYRGIIPRSVTQVFQEIGSHSDKDFTIKVSYLEIYNEQMFDLLSDVKRDPSGGSSISIQDDSKGEVHVKGLSQVIVNNEEEALNHLFEGETRKTEAQTSMNEHSSRSHSVYTIYIESKARAESTEKVIVSKLHLVDLAGNERTKKLDEKKRMKEANYINKSLSFLEQVVVSSCDSKKDHVPYRQSKLTNLLKNAVGGNCKTFMIANIWPEENNLEETISTLKFASRMMKVQNDAKVNEHQDPQMLLKKYQRQVRDLKQELQMHDALANRGHVSYDPYTPAQQYEIQQVAQAFLTGSMEEIAEISSMRQVKELLAQMRNSFRKLKQDGKNILEAEHADKEGSADSEKNALRRGTTKGEDGVGAEVDIGQFGLGRAPRESRPVNKIELTKEKEAEIAEAQEYNDYEPSVAEDTMDDDTNAMAKQRASQMKKRKPIDKQQGFIEFKSSDEGQQLEESIRDNRVELRIVKTKVKTLTETCNTSKKSIDSCKIELDRKQDERKTSLQNQLAAVDQDEIMDDEDGPQEIIDEDELALLQRMKELKKHYRAAYNELKQEKSVCSQISMSIDQAKQQLVTGFELWYEDNFDTTVHFCCANSRDGQSLDDSHIQHSIDPNSNEKIEKRLRRAKNVLIEYMKFEHSLGLKHVDIVKLIEMVLNQSDSKNEIPKKDLQKLYNRVEVIKLGQLKKVLTQQFFFTDQNRDYYDFSKIQLFNIMYCGGQEAYKASFFYKLVQSSQSGCINNGSTKLLKALEYMTIITCIVVSDALLKDGEQFPDEEDEIQFEELHQLYTTNHMIIKEFAQYINEALLFPPQKSQKGSNSSGKKNQKNNKYMTLKDFQDLMLKENLDYTLVRPNEMRQRFTEYVMRNQSKALLEQNQSMVQSEGFNFQNESIAKDRFKETREKARAKQQRLDNSFARKQKKQDRERSQEMNNSKGLQKGSQRQSNSVGLRQSSQRQAHGTSFEEKRKEYSGQRNSRNSSQRQNRSQREKNDPQAVKQSMQGTNRQSMIQSILEESDGNDEDIMENFNKQYEKQRPPKESYKSNSMQKRQQQEDVKYSEKNIDSTPPVKNYGQYEDRSGVVHTPNSMKMGNQYQNEFTVQKGKNSQNRSQHLEEVPLNKSINDTASIIDPEAMFQGNLLPSNYYLKNRNSNALVSRHSNIEKLRATARKSQRSGMSSQFMGSNNKPYKTLKQFLDDMFTEQFVQFTSNIKRLNGQNQVGEDIILLDRFEQNEQFLTQRKGEGPLPFPQNYAKRYPFQLREIFDYFQATMKKSELIGLLKGTAFSEKIINMYFKILEKMNLVQLSMDNYQRQQLMQETPDGQRNSISSNLLMGTNTMKIQYMTTNFVRKLRLQNDENTPNPSNFDSNTIDQGLLQYFNHDLILLPFFFDEIDSNSEAIEQDPSHKHVFGKNPETGEQEALCGCGHDKRSVLVSVKVLDNQVDLFDKEFRDHDSKYIFFQFFNLIYQFRS